VVDDFYGPVHGQNFEVLLLDLPGGKSGLSRWDLNSRGLPLECWGFLASCDWGGGAFDGLFGEKRVFSGLVDGSFIRRGWVMFRVQRCLACE
jgi:hypothetical protein